MLRNGNSRDDRRRRVLAEDRTAGDSGVVANPLRAAKSARPAESYTAAARHENQPCLCDFIPRSHWSFVGWVAAGVLLIASLLLAHDALADSVWNVNGDFAGFDLRSSSSLAAWFGSATLMLTSGLSFYVYSIRRCRLDDYRGRYRVWLYCAIAWFVMSIDTIAGLRHAIRAGMVHATGRTIAGDGSIWWLGPGGLIVGVLMLRLLFDVRASRLALATLSLTAIAWTGAVVISLVAVPLDEPTIVLMNAGLRLGGTWLLLVGILANARYVVLDANGELPAIEAKPKREKKPKPERAPAAEQDENIEQGNVRSAATGEKVAKIAKIDAAHTQPGKPATVTASSATISRSNVTTMSSNHSTGANATGVSKPLFSANRSDESSDDEDDEDDDSPPNDRKLSRAERKKLRKQQRG